MSGSATDWIRPDEVGSIANVSATNFIGFPCFQYMKIQRKKQKLQARLLQQSKTQPSQQQPISVLNGFGNQKRNNPFAK